MALNDTITALGNSIINLIDKKTPIATASTVGMVKPDGSTINIDANGVISSTGGGGGSSGLEICDIGMSLYVDETKGLRRYLNGQIVDRNANTEEFFKRLQEITTLYPALLCTEDEWQTAKTVSTLGQVGKFVFNYSSDEIVSVRLPRVVNVQGLIDLSNLGLTVAEGLPNHTHYGYAPDNSDDGAISQGYPAANNHSAYRTTDRGGNMRTTLRMSYASSSNSIYKDNAHVQQEAIQYPYFIQIATGAETQNNIVNDIELNNPYVFGKSEYSKTPKDNLSWLASKGQWNPKGTYPDYYDWILENVNKGVADFKLSTDTYDDYSWVINTADETFRLPLLDGSENIISGRYDELVFGASGTWYRASANGWFYFETTNAPENYFSLLGKETSIIQEYKANTAFRATPLLQVVRGEQAQINYSNSPNVVKSRFYYAQGNGTLYYYVGETVQNANLVDAGRIGEQLASIGGQLTTKVSKSGDTMTGDLVVPKLVVNCRDVYDSVTLKSSNNKEAGGHYVADITAVFPNNAHAKFESATNPDSGYGIAKIYYHNPSTDAWHFLGIDANGHVIHNDHVAHHVDSIYNNGTSWYRVWSDGWKEQGGVLVGSGDYNMQVFFLIAFSNSNYTILKNVGGGGGGGVAERWMGFWDLQTTYAWTGFTNRWERWYACGY